MLQKFFKEVYNSENYKDIINNKILLGYKKKINDEIQFWLKNSDRAEKHKEYGLRVASDDPVEYQKIGETVSAAERRRPRTDRRIM